MTTNTSGTSTEAPGHAPLTITNTTTNNASSPPPPAYQSHPLGPLSASEITLSSTLIKSLWPPSTPLHFKIITLLEPPKAELMPYLVAERSCSFQAPPLDIPRRSFIVYSLRGTHNVHEAIVNLTTSTVESNAKLGPFQHANSDGEEILAVERALLADPRVKEEVAKLKLPEGSKIVIDPWIYGSDGVKDETGKKFYDDKRVMQCFLYMRDPKNSEEEDSCHYAFPLPISPVVDPVTLEVVRVDVLPTGLGAEVNGGEVKPWTPRPGNEYIPELQKELRSDLKPLQVVQPEGVSFTVEPYSEMGRLIRWQKWDFKVGFNQREGMVVYDVHYDNKPLFYRLSLSDMAIPYSDPRHPFHRKAAFDLGDAGAGIMANNLKLGCDCLGSIYYISGVLTDGSGSPVNMPNVICVHEQDAGIGWKHTNYRTNRAVVTRQRELVLQTILTVSNYEYILSFVFNTSADLAYEARATGILSTQPVDLELSHTPHPYGTIVHPGVLAGYHQHFFSLRIDPMLSTSSTPILSPSTGPRNAIVYEECVPLPYDPSKPPSENPQNPHGTGYTLTTTPITTSGGYDLSPTTGRVFKIISPQSHNPINSLPPGYKLHIPPMQPILAHPSSFHHKRAEFADHSLYITKYREGELYAGGKYTNQSRGGTGVRSWAERRDRLDEAGDDPVVWVQFGLQHVPRTEDFPVMPVETSRVVLRPSNFFERNPAIDVRESRQEVNCSVGLSEKELGGGGKGVVGMVRELGERVLGVNLGGGAKEGEGEGEGRGGRGK
ncbi:copper amine oxidase [Sordaria brevicollis]|uniref:Amine oxidase n=1 Tax=Sordaria brevicollis TaxID=83679 RepID=A0AAE0U0M1_SORBR|nr:copper amine oxidase [Sordaria brevicollis]